MTAADIVTTLASGLRLGFAPEVIVAVAARQMRHGTACKEPS